jgi:hypothetical protein
MGLIIGIMRQEKAADLEQVLRSVVDGFGFCRDVARGEILGDAKSDWRRPDRPTATNGREGWRESAVTRTEKNGD